MKGGIRKKRKQREKGKGETGRNYTTTPAVRGREEPSHKEKGKVLQQSGGKTRREKKGRKGGS